MYRYVTTKSKPSDIIAHKGVVYKSLMIRCFMNVKRYITANSNFTMQIVQIANLQGHYELTIQLCLWMPRKEVPREGSNNAADLFGLSLVLPAKTNTWFLKAFVTDKDPLKQIRASSMITYHIPYDVCCADYQN